MPTIVLDPRSKEVWKVNLDMLRSFQPALCTRLEAYAAERGDLFEHVESKAENGTWVQDLARISFFQPDAFPPLPWKTPQEAGGSVLFVYGTGAAPWLYTLLRSLPVGPLSIVVVEPSLDLLAYTLHTTAVFRLLPVGCRLVFVNSPQEAEMYEALHHAVMDRGTYVVSRLAVYCHPGEVALWESGFRELQEDIRTRLVIRLHQMGNSMEDTLLGLRQAALLSPWIALGPGLASIKEVFRGRPFVWVASGPSLDKNFHLLKENHNRAVVICADTAASKLLQAEIVPHVIVALERGRVVHDYMEKLYTRFPEATKNILLVAQAVCVPEVVGKWPGPVTVVGKAELSLDRWFVADLLGGGLLVSGLSVAHMGVWLAAFLGASSLALIGQDLAFADGEGTRISHAEGTVSAAGAKAEVYGDFRILKNVVRVPGALGGTVETHEIWRVFLNMMEQYIPFLGCPVSDCTEGGALIRGTTVMSLAEWMDQNLTNRDSFGISPAEALMLHTPDSADREARAARVETRIHEGLKRLTAAAEALDRIVREVRRIGGAALSGERRRRMAEEIYDRLDTFHGEWPVLEFIGQGLAGVNAVRLAQSRQLADTPSVKEWSGVFEELVAAYRVSLRLMETWLRYAAQAVRTVADRWQDGYSLEPLAFFPMGSVRNLNGMEEVLGISLMEEAAKDPVKSSPLMDNLLARADHKWWHFWDPRVDWKIARMLADVGRFSEAAFFMNRFDRTEAKIFEPAEEESRAFCLELAHILTARDLCCETDWEKAASVLQNVSDAKDAAEAISRGREKDARHKAGILHSVRGSLFFDYAPQYVTEGLSRLVFDVTQLAGTAIYNRDRVLEFDVGRNGK